MKKIRIILAVITLLIVLFACLGFLGYFGSRTMRRSNLRMEARKAFAEEDWKNAEKLLKEYLEQDYDSEDDLVRLAQVYRHFDNTDEEMHCWYRASTLNPLKPEYWDNYTDCAMKARDFGHLYSTLNRKALNAGLSPEEKILFLICTFKTYRIKDAEEYYELMIEDDPKAFQQSDLGRFAEFLVTNNQLTPKERSKFLKQSIQTDDPVVRLESILLYLIDLEYSDETTDYIFEQEEAILKQEIAENRFAVTPFLANVYFFQLKFNSVIELAEPYLADINNIPLSILYAESCVYSANPEKLKPLAERIRHLGLKYALLASYFDALYDFSQGLKNSDELVKHMQELDINIQTGLANLINLQIALNTDSTEKIVSSFEKLMLNPPFFDLQERASSAIRHFLWNKIKVNPELAEDSRMARLAQLILMSGRMDPFLMRIVISDMRRRNVLTRQVIQDNLNAFPYDPYLLEAAAEFELFNGNPERCMEYAERFYELEEEKRSTAIDFLHMAALELLGRIDEATKEYTELVDNADMDRGVLYRYFRFCIQYKRQTELARMADRLNASTVPDLKALAPFFQAEELLLQGKKEEALSLLETAETEHMDFALHAANRFSSSDLLDLALSRYFELLEKHPDKRLILANIAEVYLSRDMKTEALSYAQQSWEAAQDDGLTRFVYAKMLAANGRYHDAEKILKMPYRAVELSDELRELWTDIMIHCVQEDLKNLHFLRALELSNHYLLLFPDDPLFQGLKARSEQELGIMPTPQNQEQ